MKQEEQGVGGLRGTAKCQLLVVRTNIGFSRKRCILRFPFFLRSVTKTSSSLEKQKWLVVYFLNLISVSDTVCSYIRLHPVAEIYFRFKKYTTSHFCFSRELDSLVIARKKNGNLKMYSFREKSPFVFAAKSYHFAFSFPDTGRILHYLLNSRA